MSKTTVEILLTANGKGLSSTLTKAQNGIRAFNKEVGSGTKMVGAFRNQVLGLAGAFVGFQAIGQVGAMLEQASAASYSLEASLAAANRQFEVGSADQWAATVDRLSNSLRIYSKTDLQLATAKTIDMTKRLGLSAEQMEKVILLSGDLAAGKTDLSGGVERVTAALRGEAEASEYLGLTLNENYVKAWYEASDAHEKAWKDLNDLEKAQIRYNVFLEQAIPLQGRSAKSIDTYAGAIALVKKEVNDGIAQNKDLVDALTEVAVVLRDNADDLGQMAAVMASGAAEVIAFVAANKDLLLWVAKWGLIFGGVIKVIGRLITVFRGLNAAMVVMTGTRLVPWLMQLRTVLIGAASGASALSMALKGILVVAAAASVYQIGKLISILWDWKKATNELAAAQARVKAQKDWIDPQITSRLQEINTGLGTNYKTMDELFQAQKDGKVAYDDLTGTWVRGAKEMSDATTQSANTQQQVTGKAMEAMKKQYQQYADQVKKIQGEIAGREKSLAEQLRAMGRTGMSDLGAWQDRKKEAQEYEAAAKKAAEAGNFKEAVKLADQAKTAYQDLNKEVKDGGQVLVSQDEALKTAMTGVESAGNLAIDILKKQKIAAQEAAAALDDKAGGQLSGKIKKDLDETQKALDNFSGDWGDVWEAMQKDTVAKTKKAMDNVEREIRKVVDKKTGRTVYIDVVAREKKKTGGPVGFKTGGKLPGFGGGDRIPALLEAGEFIIRKEAVSKFGSGIFHALNSFRLPELPKFAVGGPVMAVAGGNGETININLDFGTGQPINVQTSRASADELLRQVARKNRLRSA